MGCEPSKTTPIFMYVCIWTTSEHLTSLNISLFSKKNNWSRKHSKKRCGQMHMSITWHIGHLCLPVLDTLMWDPSAFWHGSYSLEIQHWRLPFIIIIHRESLSRVFTPWSSATWIKRDEPTNGWPNHVEELEVSQSRTDIVSWWMRALERHLALWRATS